jgi:para-nitrobenzyl esterase
MTDLVSVETRSGTLRGRTIDDVHIFTGVRYGEDTAPRRFRTATPVQPWEGVRDALEFGAQCVQPDLPDFELLRSGWDAPTPSSEDCLFLNIWTRGVDDGAKRPVMFNLHGGGWTVGNGNSAGRSGEDFARHHDVVRVNVNHRLGIFGYSNVADRLGSEFADSGTVGILDVVLALEWVRDNIAAFGGDPDNVTIFGVSGGGGKVCTLMALPAAKGLFRRASVESGPMLTARLPEAVAAQSNALFDALEIPADSATDILSLSGDELLAGYMKLYPDGGLLTSGIAPMIDGRNLPTHPFEPKAPDVSSDVPLMIGTTADELTVFEAMVGGPTDGLDWAGAAARLGALIPPGAPFTAQQLIDAGLAERPEAGPAEILFLAATDLFFRRPTNIIAERAADRPAPVYLWLLEWVTPVDGGKWGSPHGITVPLIMDTVEKVPSMFGDGMAAAQALSWKMSSAWAAFARDGVPAAEGLPDWQPFDAERRLTMVFDDECKLAADPLGSLRRVYSPG